MAKIDTIKIGKGVDEVVMGRGPYGFYTHEEHLAVCRERGEVPISNPEVYLS